MTVPALSLLLTETYNPVNSIVGNGISGQVSATLQAGNYSWIIRSLDLPGLVLTGEFPNEENPNSIQSQNVSVLYPYRGGTNVASQVVTRRPPRGPIGFSVVGLPIFGPESNISVAGQRGTIWQIDTVSSDVYGNDQYGGNPNSDGTYHYVSSNFIKNNAWGSISGFTDGYRHLDGHSKIIGWAADGYPIYGPYGYEEPLINTSLVRKLNSSYQQQVNKPYRPSNLKLLTRGIAVKSNVITVTNTTGVAPGLVLTGADLPGPVTVKQVSGLNLILDQRINLGTNVTIIGNWPQGIFIEDWSYQAGSGDLDLHNGRYCVTPEYPNGTYAYFATQDSSDNSVFPYFVGANLYGSLVATPPAPPPPLSWITQPGSLGILPVNLYFQYQLEAVAGIDTVYYEVIAGVLPDGVQLGINGLVSGVPTLSSLGVLGNDVTSKFVVRAYTRTVINGVTTINDFLDQTFTFTVPGRTLPQFATPAGNIGTYYDGTPITPIQLEFTSPLYTSVVRVAGGQLPPGLTLSPTGLISGYIIPSTVGSQTPGYDLTPEDIYGYDFLAVSESLNYQFTLEITDGRNANLATFEIYVYSRNNLSADDTILTADTTQVTADETPNRLPFMITPEGDLGVYQDDNFFAFKFDAVDLDGQVIEYIPVIESGPTYNWSLPQGLSLDPLTGWLYGYLPQQGLSSITYTIAIKVRDLNDPTIITDPYLYTMTVTAGLDKRVTWITPQDLGTIDNGSVSLLKIEAVTPQPRDLSYRLVSGSYSKLPAGLRLLPSGEIAGTVSYDTFALDTGRTTFDKQSRNLISTGETTFDLTYTFEVNVYSPTTQQVFYRVSSIVVDDGGQGYSANPTVTIAPPPGEGIAATVKDVTTVFVPGQGYVISSITIDNPGAGYQSPPAVTVEGSGSGAILIAQLTPTQSDFLVSETRIFTVKINRKYQAPLDTLYIQGLLSDLDRQLLTNLTQNENLIPYSALFRPDDPNFGVARNLIYVHAYGLPAESAALYQSALNLNHYRKQLLLGSVQTAQALDADGNVLYEVIYSQIQDNLVNSQGVSVGKEVTLDHPITIQEDSSAITTVYPNSLDNMRTQVIDVVGEGEISLPLWMTSLQTNGKQLGYVPAWIIAYVKPGTSAKIAYYINQQFSNSFNQIDFEVDRYVLGRQLSANWDSENDTWVPPANSTTFDQNPHYRVPESNDSSIVFNGGTGYSIGSKLLIKGSVLGGFDGFNDLTITVLDVGVVGNITYYSLTGQAEPLTQGNIYYNIPATLISGTGSGSTWDLEIASGEVTTFDQNSMQFTAPVDIYGVTDQYNKYLVFPKTNILF